MEEQRTTAPIKSLIHDLVRVQGLDLLLPRDTCGFIVAPCFGITDDCSVRRKPLKDSVKSGRLTCSREHSLPCSTFRPQSFLPPREHLDRHVNKQVVHHSNNETCFSCHCCMNCVACKEITNDRVLRTRRHTPDQIARVDITKHDRNVFI